MFFFFVFLFWAYTSLHTMQAQFIKQIYTICCFIELYIIWCSIVLYTICCCSRQFQVGLYRIFGIRIKSVLVKIIDISTLYYHWVNKYFVKSLLLDGFTTLNFQTGSNQVLNTRSGSDKTPGFCRIRIRNRNPGIS